MMEDLLVFEKRERERRKHFICSAPACYGGSCSSLDQLFCIPISHVNKALQNRYIIGSSAKERSIQSDSDCIFQTEQID